MSRWFTTVWLLLAAAPGHAAGDTDTGNEATAKAPATVAPEKDADAAKDSEPEAEAKTAAAGKGAVAGKDAQPDADDKTAAAGKAGEAGKDAKPDADDKAGDTSKGAKSADKADAAAEPDKDGAKEAKGVAQVKTAAAAEQELSVFADGYGTAGSAGLATVNVSFPRAVAIRKIHALVGQSVHAGAPLLDLATDPASLLAVRQADLTLKAAAADLARSKDLFAKQLATKGQLAAAKKALADAEAVVNAQEGADAKSANFTFKSPFDGVVATLTAAQGDRVQPGVAVMQLLPLGTKILTLGIEPQDVRHVKPGALVEVNAALDDAVKTTGTVDGVGSIVNPLTQLVDIWVRVTENPFLSGSKVYGRVTIETLKGIAVPRSAVLDDEKGSYVFVAAGGTARRLNVKKRIEGQGFVGIDGQVAAGDRIVTSGNYVLEDGMAVKEEGAN